MATFDVGALVAAFLALSVMIEQIVEGIWAIVEAFIIVFGTNGPKATSKQLTHCQRLKALADALAYKKGDVSVAPKIPADEDDTVPADDKKGRNTVPAAADDKKGRDTIAAVADDKQKGRDTLATVPADADPLDHKLKSRDTLATVPAPHWSKVAVRTTTSLAKLYQQLRALNAAAKAKRLRAKKLASGGSGSDGSASGSKAGSADPQPSAGGGAAAKPAAPADKLGDNKRQAKHMQRMQAGWGEFKKVFSSVMGVGIGIGIAYIGGNTISIAQLNTRAVHIATGVVAGLLAPYSHQLQQLFFKLQKGSSEK